MVGVGRKTSLGQGAHQVCGHLHLTIAGHQSHSGRSVEGRKSRGMAGSSEKLGFGPIDCRKSLLST